MSFYDRFELLDPVRDDGIKTFQARETETGRMLEAHLFVRPRAPESVALLAKIDRLPDSEQTKIIDRGDHDGIPYLVTEPLEESVREWLVAKTAHPVPAAAPEKPLDAAGAWKIVPPPPPPAPESTSDGQSLDQQFNNLFETGERPLKKQTIDQTLKLPTQETPAHSEPGEFTRMFQAPVPPKSGDTKQPGEFTQMFQAPAAPSKNPEAPPPGEFTRMFQAPPAPSTGSHPKSPEPPAPPPQAPPRKPQDPGEFTRFFQTPVAPGPMPQSPAVQKPLTPQPPGHSGANKMGDFTRAFGARDPQRMNPVPPPVPPMAPVDPRGATQTFAAPHMHPPPIASSSGPSEYTRMFSAPAELTLGQPSQPAPPTSTPQSAAAPNKATSYLPLVLGLAALLILITGLILFFVFRSK